MFKLVFFSFKAEDGDSVGVLALTLSAIAKNSWSGGHSNCGGGPGDPRTVPYHTTITVHGPVLGLNYVSETTTKF